MGINSEFLNKAIELSSDSDLSTATNSILEEVCCNIIDSTKYSSNINSVSFSNSSNIQIGDRVIYNGPVTITQEKPNKNKDLKIATTTVEDNNLGSSVIKKRYFIVIISTVIIFMLLVFMFILINSSNNFSEVKQYELNIVSRDDWGARPAEDDTPLNLPLERIIISHTVMRNCYTKESCKVNLKEIQDIHMGWNFGDIGFNFVIGNDGNVYEGTGWNIRGAHTRGYNSVSFGIAFNGNFETEVPNKNQVMAAFALFDEGIRLEKLKSDYKIYGMRQYLETKSPGDAFYQMIQTWDHWSETT